MMGPLYRVTMWSLAAAFSDILENILWFLKWKKLVEQCGYLTFCVSNKISRAESLKILQLIDGEHWMSKTQTFEWYKASKEK